MKNKFISVISIVICGFSMLVAQPENTKSAGPEYYRAAVQAGGFLFVAGQNAQKSDEVLTEPIAGQTEAALKLIAETLKQHGYSFNDVVSVDVFLAKQSDFADFNIAYHKYFPNRPARSTSLGVLHQDKGALVEISLVAYKADAN
ncbi:MAG: RidA family protein [Verrucomicrobiota bacterium]